VNQDRTSNDNDGSWVNSGTGSQDAVGKIGGCNYFNRSFVELPSSDSLNATYGDGSDRRPCIEFWAKLEDTSVVNMAMYGYHKDVYNRFYTRRYTELGNLRTYSYLNGSGGSSDTANYYVTDTDWHYFSFQADQNMWFFFDGENTSDAMVLVDDVTQLEAGCAVYFGDDDGDVDEQYRYIGWVDEFRVSNVFRSEGWIATSYSTMNDPGSFMSVGVEQSYAGGDSLYGSPLKMEENELWQWSNFTWMNPEIPNGTVVGWRIYYMDTSGNVNGTDGMSFTIAEESEIDADVSSCILTDEEYPGLNTCPSGDVLTPVDQYEYLNITVIDTVGNPIEGVSEGDFRFNITELTGQYVPPLNCTFNAVAPETDENGSISFEIVGNTSIQAPITIQVSIQNVTITQTVDLACKTYDLDLGGIVDLVDFALFAADYGSDAYRSDYDWDGVVGLPDFAMFAAHYGDES